MLHMSFERPNEMKHVCLYCSRLGKFVTFFYSLCILSARMHNHGYMFRSQFCTKLHWNTCNLKSMWHTAFQERNAHVHVGLEKCWDLNINIFTCTCIWKDSYSTLPFTGLLIYVFKFMLCRANLGQAFRLSRTTFV